MTAYKIGDTIETDKQEAKDPDTLIQTFCDNVCGEASPYMQEDYKLLEKVGRMAQSSSRKTTLFLFVGV